MVATLEFDNRFVNELPGDQCTDNVTRQVFEACYSRVHPTAVNSPRVIAISTDMAAQLGFSDQDCASEWFARVFGGNELLPGMDPFAMCYGGHQFGSWAGQLGDGRAITLGDVVTPNGKRLGLQLKGAGRTPYSRMADGLAVLRSSLREFLCSEAMYHLGIPTTRALSLVVTGEQVVRDILYDGHPAPEPGAVVCRVSPSFTRFGNFQIHTARNEIDLLRRIADFTIQTDFPELSLKPGNADTYVAWFEEVLDRTIQMIADWMRVGFVHGVMNTDNMSILGLTIDYGPYGWLDNYDPGWTPNTTDEPGRRYCYGRQPAIAQWNLAQFANAILPLVGDAKPLQDALDAYPSKYGTLWRSTVAQKLGWSEIQNSDVPLMEEMERVLQVAETDMTLFFRLLADIDVANMSELERPIEDLAEAYYAFDAIEPEVRERINAWIRSYAARTLADPLDLESRRERMNSVNPLYVPRNYLAQTAIDYAEAEDYDYLHELMDVLRNPYSEQSGKQRFAQKRPDWARNRPGCSMLSCSS